MDVVAGVPGGAGRAGQGQVYGCLQVNKEHFNFSKTENQLVDAKMIKNKV